MLALQFPIKKIAIEGSILALSLFPLLASAQLLPDGSIVAPTPDPLTVASIATFELQVEPQQVFSGDTVTFRVINGNFMNAETSFRWFVNNVERFDASGVGRDTFSFTTEENTYSIYLVHVIAVPPTPLAPGTVNATIPVAISSESQQQSLHDLKSDFEIDVSEINPLPGSQIHFSLVTFAYDLRRSNISWSVNGSRRTDLSGSGKSEATLTATGAGTSMVVTATVTNPDGLTRTHSVTIRPQHISTYWWSDAETPYWYRGKALPSAGTQAHVVAIVNGRVDRSLSYVWTLRGAVMKSASGTGQTTFSFPFDMQIPEQVEVGVQNSSGTIAKNINFTITPVAPRIRLYEWSEKSGVHTTESRLALVRPAGQTVSLAAQFFHTPKNGYTYSWLVNGREITGKFRIPWLLTIDSDGTQTSNLVSLNLTNSDTRQQTNGQIAVHFE